MSNASINWMKPIILWSTEAQTRVLAASRQTEDVLYLANAAPQIHKSGYKNSKTFPVDFIFAIFDIDNTKQEFSNSYFYSVNSFHPIGEINKSNSHLVQYQESISDKITLDELVRQRIRTIRPLYYNQIVLSEHYYILCYSANDINTKPGNKGYFGHKNLPGLKREFGSSAENDGFFIEAGYYKKGKRDTSGTYLVVSASGGTVHAFGSSTDVYNALTTIASKDRSDSVKNYVLIKTKNNTEGYERLCGNFDKHGKKLGATIKIIRDYLGSQPLTDDAGNSGSSYDWGTSSIQSDPYSLTITNSSIAKEYVKIFSNYKLKFTEGVDETKEGHKEANQVSVDEDRLIMTVTISPELMTVNNSTTISDTYYLYAKGEETTIAEQDFFQELDEILDLNFDYTEGTNIWNNVLPPLTDENTIIKRALLPMTACAVNKNNWLNYISDKNVLNPTLEDALLQKAIGLKDFFLSENRTDYKLLYFNVQENEGDFKTSLSDIKDFSLFLQSINPYIIYRNMKEYNCILSFYQSRGSINLYDFQIFEAYTRGHDFIQENYTTVRPTELNSNGERVMAYDSNYFLYKYSGRDFDMGDKDFAVVRECDLLLETDITLGESYGHNKYFIEYIKYFDNEYKYQDTFKVKDYLEAVDSTKFIEEDLEIITAKIDLAQCEYYHPDAATSENNWCDCSYSDAGEDNTCKQECVYQKLGYCPYRFSTEKHPRRIRTLAAEKSNRFNIIQELSSVFEMYPQFYIEFDENGKTVLDENGQMKKHVYFITEKGNHNKLGFRYEKNLKDISRTIDSTSLTTKLFVQDIDSELSKTGLCSIQTAEDNIARTSYIMDFSYYTDHGILNKEQVVRDLYGLEEGDMAFLPTIGYYNQQYDKLSNLIINLTGETMIDKKAEIDTSVEGVGSALSEKQKIAQKMYQFKIKSIAENGNEEYTTSDTYENYLIKMKEHSTILWGLIENLFFSGDHYNLINVYTHPQKGKTYSFTNATWGGEVINNELSNSWNTLQNTYCKGEFWWRLNIEGFEEVPEYMPLFESWEVFKEEVVDKNLYPTNGKLGQYKDMYEQVKVWKTSREKWLNKINDISQKFYQKYEPFIKEGTWSDDNYLTDNEYYWAGVNVLSDSCKPKVTYNISVVNLNALDDDYKFDLADTSYIEDIDFFGVNTKTGLPNKQKVLISDINYDLDNPMNDSIEVKNYTSSFDELFESISASVQSLTFNENTYKRASNFTATKYITKEALQGTLFEGDLTLMDIHQKNLVIDENGAQGENIANRSIGYKLTGDGLLFTKDGGQTWDLGVGPNGINADYIKFGQLDASKIQIVDGNYIYFLWDKAGITAYRNPAASTNGLVDFTRFNKYGLSLIENNNIRLRAGYEFKTEGIKGISGDYRTEQELTTQNIGFYLYNNSGQAIFKTETSSDYAGESADYSTRLSLTGEMFITNKVLDGDNSGSVISKISEYDYSDGYQIQDESIPWISTRAIATDADFGYTIENGYTEGEYVYFFSKDLTSEEMDKISSVTDIDEFLNQTYSTDNQTAYIQKLVDEGQDITIPTYYYFENQLYKNSSEITAAKKKQYTNYQLTLVHNTTNPTAGYEWYVDLNESKLYIKYPKNVIQERVDEASYNSMVLTLYTFNNQEYVSNNITLKLLTHHEPNVFTTSIAVTAKETVSFYDPENTTQTADGKTVINISNEELWAYEDAVGANISYNYWFAKEYNGNTYELESSGVITDEVGIFINNKTALSGTSISQQNAVNDEEENTEQENAEEESTENVSTFSLQRSGSSVDITANNFAIIGDSITVGLQTTALGASKALGISSTGIINLEDFKYYYSDYDSLIKNSSAYNESAINLAFFFGMNDAAYEYDEETIRSEYQETVKALSEKFNNATTKNIFIISTIATGEGASVTNEQIQTFNKYAKSFAASEGYTFIDIYGESKTLSRDKDAIHLTKSGYEQLYNLIAKHFDSTVTDTYVDYTQIDPNVEEAANTALAGSERIFMIAMAGRNSSGKTVYNNILSVLKNGCLYMGGQVTDYYGGELNLKNFNLLPDEVRISNPNFVVTNNGYIWMDFDKVYRIADGVYDATASLMEILQGISGAGSAGDSNLPSGYYLINPLEG